MKKIWWIVVLIFVSGCNYIKNEKEDIQSINSVFRAFDTIFELIVYTNNQEEFDRYFNYFKEESKYYHMVFDKYKKYEGINNIKSINDNAGKQAVKVDNVLMDFVLESKKIFEITQGYVDITLGSVLNVWHEYREEGLSLNYENKYGNVPSFDELSTAKRYTGWEYIEIDEKNSTIYITDANVSLDVGALAKGYFTEMISYELKYMGMERGIINAGGNIKLIGEKEDKSKWNVGLREPILFAQHPLMIVAVGADYSMVTSGDYERYYEAVLNGEVVGLSHLIDPFTLFPVSNARSVSIATENALYADALSTYFFLLSMDESVDKIEEFRNSLFDINVYWIYDDYKGEITGIDYYLTVGQDKTEYHLYAFE